ALIGAWLLTEALEFLESRGVPRSTLIRKLRDDRSVWPTWAELTSAAQLARALSASSMVLKSRPGRSAGPHPDFAFESASGTVHVEFKAVGLSDEEVCFCERVGPALRAVCPSEGIVTLRVHPEAPEITVTSQLQAHTEREAPARLRAKLGE